MLVLSVWKQKKKRENEAQSTAGFSKLVDVMKGEKEKAGEKTINPKEKKRKKNSVIFFLQVDYEQNTLAEIFFSIHKSVRSLSTSIT